MQLGMIGLGRMGANMVRRLFNGGAGVPFAQAAVAYAREPVRNRRPGKTVVSC
jgi:6-phosphogluconate dehydrogenase (decarboxylating)